MNNIKEKIKDIINSGSAGSVLAVIKKGINIVPLEISSANISEVENLCTDERRYPIEKMLLSVLGSRTNKLPAGIVVRRCEKSAVIELHKLQRLDIKDVIFIDAECADELYEKCRCPWKDNESGNIGTETDALLNNLESMTARERWDFWTANFARCIKCYGCRNICPVCVCKTCCLEENDIVAKGELPPEFPMYHTARAVDVAGRCIDCGKCEEVCPVDIPLRLIHKKVFRDFIKEFAYVPGASVDEKCPLDFIEDIKREGE